ncbi:4-vinyl reductase [bacterium]|nr:4-vinyl reductase [bacterium]
MFNEERDYNKFSWEDLGDIEEGRPELGLEVPVFLYRLFQYTLRDVLITEFSVEKANDIIEKTGKLAGFHFCENMLNKDIDFNMFVAELQKVLKDNKIGLLRLEKADLKSLEMTLTVAEDLDCSGLPFTDEVVCKFDEGFIAGILESYTGKQFRVKEIDCWASGDRVCRFDARPEEELK